MGLINVNGSYFSEEKPVLLSANRSFRYGDGLFETLKIINRTIALKELHFDRFFKGLKILEIIIPGNINRKWFENEILALCEKNEMTDARIRLSAWSGEGDLQKTERSFNYLIESTALQHTSDRLNKDGLRLGLFENGRKSIDSYSNLKSASSLVYAMAAKKALDNDWDNNIILNSNESVAETTNANIFIIKEGKIFTPPLQDGCVAGVMRRFILENMANDFSIEERSLSIQHIEHADEIFLTNAIRDIQWVKTFNDVAYSNTITQKVNESFLKLYKQSVGKN